MSPGTIKYLLVYNAVIYKIFKLNYFFNLTFASNLPPHMFISLLFKHFWEATEK